MTPWRLQASWEPFLIWLRPFSFFPSGAAGLESFTLPLGGGAGTGFFFPGGGGAGTGFFFTGGGGALLTGGGAFSTGGDGSLSTTGFSATGVSGSFISIPDESFASKGCVESPLMEIPEVFFFRARGGVGSFGFSSAGGGVAGFGFSSAEGALGLMLNLEAVPKL